MTTIRCACAGASGTGKSVLTKFISETYNIPINPIGSRSVSLAMGFASPYDVDKAGKRDEFQRRLVVDKREWELANDSFVSDRSTCDNLSYSVLHSVYSIDENLITQVHDGMQRYTHVILCSMDGVFNPGDDAARVKDKTYHNIYEIVLGGLLGVHLQEPTKVLMLQANDKSERQRLVKEFLDK